jgi:putative hydrolase of the HAD superfamily
MSGKLLIWDFDGTLAFRHGKWSGALVEVLDSVYPGHGFNSEHFRSYVQSGFPWHCWEQVNQPGLAPGLWWERLIPIFKYAYIGGANYADAEATRLAKLVRECYLNRARWELYDDVASTFSLLKESGYRQVVLSNHVPELNQLLDGLGIASSFEWVFNSAITGLEKPNPAAFFQVKAAYPEVKWFVMIGDSLRADVSGAEAVGIPAILVRNPSGKTKRECSSLNELAVQIEELNA